MTPIVLLSVRSQHVERLLSGAKTVEFRRRPWKVPNGATVLLYESRGRRAIVGSLIVESTVVGSRTAIWASHGARSGLTRREYREYFAGATVAVAINVGRVRQLGEPLTLNELRRRSPTFHVPQSYRFMGTDELGVVLNGERHSLLGLSVAGSAT
jgi:predicted transcriptional regulator